ncbi:hypothetical protein L198_00699 [Cryptococcus wingfieldii CBS 7118]|uniref:SANT domain-containing protein n=1 Tax=Cryptococcus wingfieldii CBS 7118 TaxID=1295528 RepID=A0A1E3K745_9TREE|nr:hypothetical protein L198_00699 [Cryptococcus wingfieldii CBS 7118]ODO08960.1 hypothetical protein L198_00699 [Cryptococcus wingfieldii CBS 7118]
MHPDTGPSRAPSYPLKPIPPGGGLKRSPPPRAGPSRWDDFDRERERDGYRGDGPAPRPYPIPAWSNRPPRQTSRYPPGPNSRPRSLSPSPPRRSFDRPSTWERDPPRAGRDWERERDLDSRYDVRDRVSLDAGWQGENRTLRRPSSFSPLPSRIPPGERRDERASWGERERWDERDRALRGRTPPHLVGSRYPPSRARSPPPPIVRGPRPTPAASTSYPARIPPGRPPPLRDDRNFQPRRTSGGASSPRAVYPSNVQPSPTHSKFSEPILSGHARSQRGSSSPIDHKRSRDFDRPLSLPPSTAPISAFAPLAVKTESPPSPAPQPTQIQAGDDDKRDGGEAEEDLEEGEVVSPVHVSRPTPAWDEPPRRWSPPRERERPLPPWEREREWARDRERERDLSWEREREREREMDRRRGSPPPGLGLDGWRRSPEPREPREREPWGTRPRQSLSNPPRERVASLEIPAAAKPAQEPALTIEAVPEKVQKKDKEPEEGELPSTSPAVPTHELVEESKVDQPATPPVPPPASIEPASEAEPQPELAAPLAEPDQVAEAQFLEQPSPKGVNTVEKSQTPATPSFPPPSSTPAPPVPLPTVDLSLPATPALPASENQSEDVVMENQVIATRVGVLLTTQARPEGEDVVMAEAEVEVTQEETKDVLPTAPAAQVVQVSESELSLSTETVVAQKVIAESDSMGVDVPENVPQTPTTLPPPPVPAPEPSSTSTNRSTIAERRSILLPPTTAPFDRTPLKDPMPTNSTDHTEDAGPPTGPIGGTPGPDREEQEEDEDDADDEDRMEEMRQMRLVAAVKQAQGKEIVFHDFPILAWNLAAAPEETSRVIAKTDAEREKYLRKITKPMRKQQTHAAKFVGIIVAREKKGEERKVRELRQEYLELNEEWMEHIAYLDGLMKERGEPPADFQTLLGPTGVTNAFPGAQPTTPGVDEFFSSHSSRSNRRRGLGDIVSTDAELEEIMAAIAQQEQSDPLLRAAKTAAVVPDMILSEERGLKYDDDNDLVQDPISFYDFEGIEEPIWTSEERAIFVKRYLAYPKQFGRISDGIPNKSAGDCVLYYYRTKKEVDYKAMLAHKRGGGKRKLALKKGVKSSALMADLTRAKPTVPGKDDGPVSTPVRAREASVSFAPTTGRRGRGGHVGEGGRRKKRGSQVSVPVTPSEEHDEETYGESASTSRAGSETPATSGKSKMRMTVKTAKRPRVSSIPEIATTPSHASFSSVPNSAVTEAVTPIGGGADMGTELAANALASLADAASSAAQAELVPPVRRPGKRRKVTAPVEGEPQTPNPNADPADPSAPAVNGAAPAPPAEKPARRSATNSYWSVEEKRKVKELVSVHGMEAKLIAAQLKGKSERQVVNYMEGHRAELEPLEGSAVETSDKAQVAESAREPSSSAGRTIYDAFPAFASADRYEPRLGTFPTAKPPTTAIPSLPPPQPRAPSPAQDSSPTRPIQRTGGGMRISALLNDDVPAETKPVLETVPETGSDGTVEESPKGAPPAPSTTVPSYRYEPPQHLDERYSTSRPSHSPSLPPLGYPSSAGWNGHQEQHRRPQTAMPAPDWSHRRSWDAHPHPSQLPRASSYGGQPSLHSPYDNLPPIRSQTPLGPSFMNNHLDRHVSRDRDASLPHPGGLGGRDEERRVDEKEGRFGGVNLLAMRYHENGHVHGSEMREERQEPRRHSDGA